jgi:hypothetical protein
LLTYLLYRLLCGFVRLLACRGGERELESVVLRYQVAILRRGGRRPQYTAADLALLAAVSRLLPPERWSSFAVSPQTLCRWHRALLQGKRRRRPRRPGRPPLAAQTRSLILRIARENPRWGYMRIQGELLKLGINVSATTVATVLRVSGLGPAPRRIGPSWSEFLRAQAQSMLGAGLPVGCQNSVRPPRNCRFAGRTLIFVPHRATTGNQRQIARPPKPQRQAKSVALGCRALPESSNGKERVTEGYEHAPTSGLRGRSDWAGAFQRVSPASARPRSSRNGEDSPAATNFSPARAIHR